MLRKLQQHPLLASTGEALANAVRYVALMVALLGSVARLGAGAR